MVNRTLTLDNAIRNIASSIGDTEAKSYIELLRLANLGLDDLGMHIMRHKPYYVLTVNDNLTADLPEDCIQPIKIGYVTTTGVLVPLLEIDQQFLDAKNKICQDDIDTTPEEYIEFEEFVPLDNGYYGEWYSSTENYSPGGRWSFNPAKKRIDFMAGEIVKSGRKLVMVYVSSKIEKELINIEAYQMLRAWVLWNFFEVSRPNTAERFRQRLKLEVGRYNDLTLQLTNDDVLGAILESYQNVPS